jgi:hypothetical protein
MCVQVEGEGETLVFRAVRLFFKHTNFADGWALGSLLLPRWLLPVYYWVVSFLNPDAAAINESMDIIYAATWQMVKAYCEHHPELKADVELDKDIMGAGLHLKPLPEGLVPSEESLIANLMQARNKCELLEH